MIRKLKNLTLSVCFRASANGKTARIVHDISDSQRRTKNHVLLPLFSPSNF